MRVAIVDIGSNSTRLLIADVGREDGKIEEVLRRSHVTRLGDRLDAQGSLSTQAIDRVLATLADYRRDIDRHACTANLAVLTAAVREASNGPEFAALVREQYGLDARVLSGEQEAELTFIGAVSGGLSDIVSAGHEHVLVVDIGGGSTEFIVGRGPIADYHRSLPVGVVRMSERHIRSDPPEPHELSQLARDTREIFQAGLSQAARARVGAGIAVAGTATSAAAMDLELDPYDPARIHGHPLPLAVVERLLTRTAAMTDLQRRSIVGLHPDRAPTILAGLIILAEALGAFGLDAVTVSEHDILFGGALRLAGLA